MVSSTYNVKQHAHSVPDLINDPLMCILKTVFKNHEIEIQRTDNMLFFVHLQGLF